MWIKVYRAILLLVMPNGMARSSGWRWKYEKGHTVTLLDCVGSQRWEAVLKGGCSDNNSDKKVNAAVLSVLLSPLNFLQTFHMKTSHGTSLLHWCFGNKLQGTRMWWKGGKRCFSGLGIDSVTATWR